MIETSKIIKRLELIKSLIALEEEIEISAHVTKLEQHILTTDVQDIIQTLKYKSYSQALIAIETFIKEHHRIILYIDPQIAALRLEIKSLEVELSELSDEKADLEKLIHEFGVKHSNELSQLLSKILQYRIEKAKGTPKEKEAEEDFKTYERHFESSKEERVISLTDNELKELKYKYRKASKLCHPDVVSDVQKELATKLFLELRIAYENNDLTKVNEILNNLEKGNFFVHKSDEITEMHLIQTEIEKLHLRIKELKEEIEFIKKSDTYNTIISIGNWDAYFERTKQELILQLNQYEDGK